MVAAIELYFDGAAERRLRTLWKALDAANVPSLSQHTHQRHRPHLSIAVADAFQPADVAEAFAGMLMPPPLTVSFQHVGQFPGGVLWLGPAPTADLLAFHSDALRRLDAHGIVVWELYHPGTWVPHSTLSMNARREAISRAVPICCDVLPLPATLTSAAVVDHTRGQYHPIAQTVQRSR